MCTGVEPAIIYGLMAAGTAVTAGAAVYAGEQAEKQADAAAAQASADADAARGEAMVRARGIRAAGKRAQSEAVAALAASGVEVQSGTAEQIQSDIFERAEQDAITEVLFGSNQGRRLDREGTLARIGGDNARTAGYVNATSSVLSSVSSYQRGDWKRRS